MSDDLRQYITDTSIHMESPLVYSLKRTETGSELRDYGVRTKN